jgi:hypothetical protein
MVRVLDFFLPLSSFVLPPHILLLIRPFAHYLTLTLSTVLPPSFQHHLSLSLTVSKEKFSDPDNYTIISSVHEHVFVVSRQPMATKRWRWHSMRRQNAADAAMAPGRSLPIGTSAEYDLCPSIKVAKRLV